MVEVGEGLISKRVSGGRLRFINGWITLILLISAESAIT